MSHESGTLRTRLLPAAIACLALLGVAPLGAQEPAKASPAQAGREHVVRKGDTLWDIARQYLNNPFLWPSIYQANKGLIRDPNLIFPAERLVIPPVVATAAATKPPATPAAPAAAAAPPAAAAPSPGTPVQPAEAGSGAEQRTVFYRSDAAAQMDTVATRELPVVPADEFYASPWLDNPHALPVVARLVREVDPRTGHDRLEHSLHPQQSVYLDYRGGTPPQPGLQLQLEAVGRTIGSWGTIIQPVAILRVDSVASGMVVATIAQQYAAVTRGQQAVALPKYPGSPTRTQPVENGPRGTVVGFLEDQPLYGTMDVAFVSLGRAQGVAVGDQLEAYEAPERAEGSGGRDLPRVALARMTVVRAGERVSTVRITGVTHAGLRVGVPVQLVGKAP